MLFTGRKEIQGKQYKIMEKENNKEQRPTYSKFPSLSQSQPWLVFVHGKNRQRQTFFNILEGRYYVKIIPEMRNKRICSSSHGWLVLKDLSSQDCFFLNPMTLEKIQLPSLHGFKMLSCSLSSPPTNTKSCLFFICEGNRFLFRLHGDINFHVRNIVLEDEDDVLKLAVFFKGRFYGLTIPSLKLVVQEKIESSRVRFGEVIKSGSLSFELSFLSDKLYMVTSCDKLFLLRKVYSDSFVDCGKVLDFEIFRVDFSKMAWEKVTNIDKHTIFLSNYRDYDKSCLVNEPGIKGNSIYFTEGRHLYVYDLDDRSISISLPCPLVAEHWIRSFQYWIKF